MTGCFWCCPNWENPVCLRESRLSSMSWRETFQCPCVYGSWNVCKSPPHAWIRDPIAIPPHRPFHDVQSGCVPPATLNRLTVHYLLYTTTLETSSETTSLPSVGRPPAPSGSTELKTSPETTSSLSIGLLPPPTDPNDLTTTPGPFRRRGGPPYLHAETTRDDPGLKRNGKRITRQKEKRMIGLSWFTILGV